MSDPVRPRVLVTGAAGRVARRIQPWLTKDLDLVLTDLHAVAPDAPDTPPLDASVPFLAGDLTDPGLLAEAVTGMDAVIHLAGNPSPMAPWAVVSRVNLDLTAALLAACVDAGVRTVVYGSSIHAVGGYVRDGATSVETGWAPSPCCAYGASKAAAEAVGRLYAGIASVDVVSLRIGMPLTEPDPARPFSLRSWVSLPDLAQLVLRSVLAPVSGVYHAVSPNTRSVWSIEDARTRLGWSPTGDAEGAAALMDPEAPAEPLCFRRPPR